MLKILPVWCFGVLIFVVTAVKIASTCNEAVCASIVSKCMLTQSCKCDLKNCTCCRDCYNCLDDLYYECCSCVEMCPKPNNTDIKLNQNSQVEQLSEPIPELFNALTEEQDTQLRWVAYTFPALQGLAVFSPKMEKEMKLVAVSSEEEWDKYKDDEITVNCTVVFMSHCMSWTKCKQSCTSMGASSFRWFHDGCCECVGNTCLNFGIGESRCLKCPANKDNNDGLEDPEEMDLDEEMDVEEEDKDKTSSEINHGDANHEMDDITKVEKNEVSE